MRRAFAVLLVVALTALAPGRQVAAQETAPCMLTADEALSRAEFAVLLARALGLSEAVGQATGDPVFTDLSGHWAAGYVKGLREQGIVKGYPGGGFGPEDKITLAQAQVMLARTLGLGNELPPESAEAALGRAGVDTAVPCATAQGVTRAQAVLLVDRTLSAPLFTRWPAYTGDPLWAPKLDEIAWAQVRMGLPGSDATLPLYPERAPDVPVLIRLAEWLRKARPVTGEISKPGYGPSLTIRLKDGRSMWTHIAYDCVTEQTAESLSVTCQYAEGQVILYPAEGGAIRLRAPELAAWLIGGWEADVVMAPELAVTPLAGDRYRVQGDGWAEASQMTLWLAGEVPYTCCPPSNGTQLAVMPVIMGHFTWEGSVPGSGRFKLLVSGDQGGARSIWVDRSPPPSETGTIQGISN